MTQKFSQFLEASGLPLSYQAGGQAPREMIDQEVKREPCPRARKLRDL